MKPEKLKVIAEGMRHEVTLGTATQWEGVVLTWVKDKHEPYNPLNNAEQLAEIIEKTKMSVHYASANEVWDAVIYLRNVGDIVMWTSENRKEAVCNAAFKYFSEVKG